MRRRSTRSTWSNAGFKFEDDTAHEILTIIVGRTNLSSVADHQVFLRDTSALLYPDNRACMLARKLASVHCVSTCNTHVLPGKCDGILLTKHKVTPHSCCYAYELGQI